MENRGLLSKAKYLRKKIKAGKIEDWMVERFETILAMRSNEHTGGRKKNPSTCSGTDAPIQSVELLLEL